MCVWNSYCLYELKTDKQISMAKFHLELIHQLLSHNIQGNNNNISTVLARRLVQPERLAGETSSGERIKWVSH